MAGVRPLSYFVCFVDFVVRSGSGIDHEIDETHEMEEGIFRPSAGRAAGPRMPTTAPGAPGADQAGHFGEAIRLPQVRAGPSWRKPAIPTADELAQPMAELEGYSRTQHANIAPSPTSTSN